jgi:hypothetical protein
MINITEPQKRLCDIENIFLTGNTEIETKADLAKIVEEPCLAVCENLYDKNILTYWSSANKYAPNRAYVLIRYESLDDINKKIANDLIKQGILSDTKYIFDSYNKADEYGKGLYLGIDTNPDMFVSDISKKLCQIADNFVLQDIKYNVYTPEYLLSKDPFTQTKKVFAFPDLKTTIYGKQHIKESDKEKIYDYIEIMIHSKQDLGLTSEDMRTIAEKIGWLYNEENGFLYKDNETLRRHNEYIQNACANKIEIIKQGSNKVISLFEKNTPVNNVQKTCSRES